MPAGMAGLDAATGVAAWLSNSVQRDLAVFQLPFLHVADTAGHDFINDARRVLRGAEVDGEAVLFHRGDGIIIGLSNYLPLCVRPGRLASRKILRGRIWTRGGTIFSYFFALKACTLGRHQANTGAEGE